MKSKRAVISYALKRRNTLARLTHPSRALSFEDPCDADRILISSAIHHGYSAGEPCPVCHRAGLMRLNYVFGDQLGQYSGRIKSDAELEEMETEFGEFTVHVVEVCPDCKWNYLILSFQLGDGITRPKPRHQRTVEDIYG
jgi:hypothetical protein